MAGLAVIQWMVDTLGILALPLLALAELLVVAGAWKALAAMGRRRWAALVPVFAGYELCEGASGDRGLSAAVVVTGVLWVLPVNWAAAGLAWVDALVALAALAVSCVASHKLSRAFGLGPSWTVALVLVPFLALPALTSGNACYLGPVDLPRAC